jgi:exonuclease I
MSDDYVEVELVDWDQLLQVLAVRREFLYRRRENQSQQLEIAIVDAHLNELGIVTGIINTLRGEDDE